VRDHGAGVPLEDRARIFERFYQGHGGVYQAGLGLGLYLCRRIVERHGGEIRAEFPEDGGSRFVVTLPTGVEGGRPAETQPLDMKDSRRASSASS
jgi:signal transduction histidine kinase